MVEDGILHSHRLENLKLSSINRLGSVVASFPVSYEAGFYIPEDDIRHSRRREKHKFYAALTDWAL
jgi:hypothetical protein